MFSLLVFIISLALIAFLFVMKGVEIYYGKKIFLENLFARCDVKILTFISKLKYWWSHVNFKNVRLVFSWIIFSTHRLIVAVKRRFDHKQSHFFTERKPDHLKPKGAPSFFLKDVSDYKKSLREGNMDKEN